MPKPGSPRYDSASAASPGLRAGTQFPTQAADAQIRANPSFAMLIHHRNRLAWALTAIMLAVYFGFVGLVAFAPATMAVPISRTITLGFLLGLIVIFTAIALTGLYVLRANAEFDALTRRIVEDTP